MPELSRHENAYVRPSPSSCTLGGVARNTNEAILLCEADMVDMFTLLVAPGGGDELQGMKKGIVELSDLILVNKADGDMMAPARTAQSEYTSALKFLQPIFSEWKPEVLRVSSLQQTGIDEAWSKMKEFYHLMQSCGELDRKRGHQRKTWMWKQINDELLWRLKTDQHVKEMVQRLERA
ncbi:hypothetical protein HK104_004681, partial [Borealophlyctis nickersoniae]